MANQTQVARWMETQLRDNPNDPQWVDPITGETNSTRLAEDAAEHFDDYIYEDGDEWGIPQHIWDAASDVAIARDERLSQQIGDY